jgi:hypothetical protein
MKRILLLVLALAVLVSIALVPVALAAPPDNPANDRNNGVGRSNNAFVYFYQKDPLTWEVVPDGAWGKMKHNLRGDTFDYNFNGHELAPGQDYTLVIYGPDWPDALCLGFGTTDVDGNIHIAGSWSGTLSDAKLWLVLSSDVDCDAGAMTAWNPGTYLFEWDTITFPGP